MKSDNNVIHVDLDNRDEYINKYNDNMICDDLHNYLINEAIKISNKTRIILKIKFNYDVDEDEKNRVKKLIKNDFNDSLNDKITFNSIAIKDIYLILIGIACIIVSVMFRYLKISVISEVFLIIGWVPIWELVSNILFIESDERMIKRKYKQLLRASIIVE